MNLQQRFIDKEVVGEAIHDLSLQCKLSGCSTQVANLDQILDEGEPFFCFVSDQKPACKTHAAEFSEDVVRVTSCEYFSEWNGDWMTDEWIEITDAEPGPEFQLRESDITPDLFVKNNMRKCPGCNAEYELGIGIQGPPDHQYFECPDCAELLDIVESDLT